MTKTASDKPIRRASGATPYAALWFTLGGAGLGYLCVAFFAPHLLPDFSGGRLAGGSEAQVMRVAADVEDLKSSLSKLQLDVDSVKADVSAQAAHTDQLSSKLAALDEKMQAPPMQTSALAEPVPPPTPDVPDFSGAPQQHAEEEAHDTPPPTKVINAAPAAPKVGEIVTGSVNKSNKAASEEAISFGPAVVKAEPKPVGIQLATDRSVDALRITWSALAQLHGDTLGSLTAQYADLGTAANPNYGLIAGPIKSKTEAKKICKELAAQSVSCKISDFKGAAL